MEQTLPTTIAARLTAEVPAAIATVAVRGPQAHQCVQERVRLASQRLQIGGVYYGTWQFSQQSMAGSEPSKEPPVEQVVVCPTAADTVEVHCHGGPAVCQAILQDLAAAGCRLVSQWSWPSHYSCPVAQAAEQDLLLTTTDRASAILLDQMQGALRQAIEELQATLRHGDVNTAHKDLQVLLHWADFGLHLSQPWTIVLAGPPNVGKSSLMNALVGTQQAIVHHEPGTTRDWIEAAGAIDGLPVLFTDTAGVRAGEDAIEQAGVERSQYRLRHSDLAIFVIDARQGWTSVHAHLLELAPARRLLVWNKIDLVEAAHVPRHIQTERHNIPTHLPSVITSTVNDPGTGGLLEAIAQALFPVFPEAQAAVPFRREHVQCLLNCGRWLQEGQCLRAAQELETLLAVQ